MNLQFIHIKQLKQLPVLGQTNDPKKPLTRTQDEVDFASKIDGILEQLTGFTNSVDDAVKALNTKQSNLSTGLNVLIGIQETYNKKVADTIYQTTFLENENKNLNESFHVTSGTAQDFAVNLRGLAVDAGYGYEKISQYAIELEELTGGMITAKNASGALQQAMIAGQAYMQANLKMTSENAQGYERFANQAGKTSIDFLGATKGFAEAISEKTGIDALKTQYDIMSGIGALTEDIQLQYGRIPGNLELSVLKAKSLGIAMAQLNTAGEKLMDIESSVGDELQYQLLTGKRLLVDGEKSWTNEYRIAQMKGDSNRQLDLMGQLMEKEGDNLRNNYLARKQMSQLLGIDEKTLSSMLQKEKVARELGVKDVLKLQPEQFADKIKELKEAAAKETDAAIKEDRLKKIKQLEESGDTRTTHEKAIETSLSQIAATIGKISGGKRGATPSEAGYDIDVTQVSKDALAFKGVVDKVKNVLGDSKDVAEFAGKVKNFQNALETIKEPTKKVSDALGVVDKFTDLLDKIEKMAKDYTIDANKLPLGSVKKQDAVFYPDDNGSKPVSFASNDTVVAFKPGGPVEQSSRRYMQEQIAQAADNITTNNQSIHKQMYQTEYLRSNVTNNASAIKPADLSRLAAAISSTIKSNTNNQPPFDINNLASSIGKSIAYEMSRVKLEAKVKTDNLFAATTMNGARRI